jgi:hypothetical protein
MDIIKNINITVSASYVVSTLKGLRENHSGLRTLKKESHGDSIGDAHTIPSLPPETLVITFFVDIIWVKIVVLVMYLGGFL